MPRLHCDYDGNDERESRIGIVMRANRKPPRRNIFAAGTDATFGLSLPIFEKLLAADVKGRPSVIQLYVYFVSKATAPSVRLHTGDILHETRMSRPTFLQARDTLCSLKLIRARETNRQGFWEYEFRTKSGHALPTFDGFVDFKKVPADEIEAFYADRMGFKMAQGEAPGGNLLFDCPFHVAATPKKQRTLTVTIDGGEYHGHFICNNSKCKRHGGFIHFEKMLAEQQGKDITWDEAKRSVVSFLSSRNWAADQGLTDESNPALKELLEPLPLNVTL